MDINATLIVEIIVFLLFVRFTMKYIWPPMMKALKDREQKIAEGIEAGERGKRRLEMAHHQTLEMLQKAKGEAIKIIDQAQRQSTKLIDESKDRGLLESKKIITQAQAEIAQQLQETKRALRLEMADLVVAGVEKILEKQVDRSAHEALFNQLMTEI
ncbi:MAG: F0F1 ATP synthase subunit B [Gammaproteobacteria bacterium GWF2_41_13]|nr:MAG: F0F1 ATP synthase subunit B [Gammaproteobacteria bacterium GWF2_41_13]